MSTPTLPRGRLTPQRLHIICMMAAASLTLTPEQETRELILDGRRAIQTYGLEMWQPGLTRMREDIRAAWVAWARTAPAGELSPFEIAALASCADVAAPAHGLTPASTMGGAW